MLNNNQSKGYVHTVDIFIRRIHSRNPRRTSLCCRFFCAFRHALFNGANLGPGYPTQFTFTALISDMWISNSIGKSLNSSLQSA